MKNGLVYENGELVYYQKDVPVHAGVIRDKDAIYYIDSEGRAVKGRRVVHKEKANGILNHGTYTFGEDYKLVPGSYIAPKVIKEKKPKKSAKDKINQWPNLILQYLQDIQEMGYMREIARTALSVVLVLGLIGVARMVENRAEPNDSLPTTPSTNVTAGETADKTVAGKENTAPKENTTPNENTTPKEKEGVSFPSYTEDVLLCSQAAKMEYDGEITLREAITAGDPYRPFVFKYAFQNDSGTLWLGEQKDLSDATQYELSRSEQNLLIHNLKVDTDYYYKVLVGGEEYLGSFHTAPSTRYLYIPGLENVRDIGGGTTQDGKKVKQGLLIRGSEMDGLTTATCFIQEEQGKEVQQEFGFVYDMDLRAAHIYISEYYSKLGVPQNFYFAPQYGEIFNTYYSAALKRIFQDLAKPENYPMYMHCNWGRDRTGTIVFLLQAVLNMSEEDMWQEFRRSAYSYSKMAISEDMQVIIAGLEPYEGDTLQEKILTYLTTEIGVTQEEIESIRSILLEDAQ